MEWLSVYVVLDLITMFMYQWSGFTPVNTPKIMPNVICEHVEKNKLQGKMKFHLFLGASTIGGTVFW